MGPPPKGVLWVGGSPKAAGISSIVGSFLFHAHGCVLVARGPASGESFFSPFSLPCEGFVGSLSIGNLGAMPTQQRNLWAAVLLLRLENETANIFLIICERHGWTAHVRDSGKYVNTGPSCQPRFLGYLIPWPCYRLVLCLLVAWRAPPTHVRVVRKALSTISDQRKPSIA